MDILEFENMLLSAGLTKQSFSEYTGISIATIKEWFAKRNGLNKQCPNWVKAYLRLYIENNENQIYIKKLLQELKGGN